MPESPTLHRDYCALCQVRFAPSDEAAWRVYVGKDQANVVRIHRMTAPKNCIERWDAGERPVRGRSV